MSKGTHFKQYNKTGWTNETLPHVFLKAYLTIHGNGEKVVIFEDMYLFFVNLFDIIHFSRCWENWVEYFLNIMHYKLLTKVFKLLRTLPKFVKTYRICLFCRDFVHFSELCFFPKTIYIPVPFTTVWSSDSGCHFLWSWMKRERESGMDFCEDKTCGNINKRGQGWTKLANREIFVNILWFFCNFVGIFV